MPVDVDALVLANTRLSGEYNIISLDAPAVAAAVQPGQFVMVRTSRGLDPLLRRPFSVFEVLRDADGRPRGVTLLNKRVGVGTTLLYALAAGDRVGCLGPLGRPFTPVGPPAEGWMVAGGVGLAPFATLAEALVARGARPRLFYGARRGDELFHLELFERLGVELHLATDDGSRGSRGLVSAPFGEALARQAADVPLAVYACGPTPMMRAIAALATRFARPVQVSLEPVMGCGLGGCYSCVVKVREPGGSAHNVRACLEGPVFEGERLVWEALAH